MSVPTGSVGAGEIQQRWELRQSIDLLGSGRSVAAATSQPDAVQARRSGRQRVDVEPVTDVHRVLRWHTQLSAGQSENLRMGFCHAQSSGGQHDLEVAAQAGACDLVLLLALVLVGQRSDPGDARKLSRQGLTSGKHRHVASYAAR